MINLAESFRAEKNFQQMGALFDDVLELDPKNFHALIGKGFILQNYKRHNEAIPVYEQVIELAPSRQVEAYSSVAVMYNIMKRIPEAEKRFKDALFMKPDYISARFNYGNLLKGEKAREDEAIYQYKLTMAGNPRYAGFADTYNNLAATQLQIKKYDEAISTWKTGLKIAPHRSDMWSNLGIVYNNIGRMDEAIKAQKKAVGMRGDEQNIKRLKQFQAKKAHQDSQ
jgi:tetratricopeptide (TPR) repeat protein